MPEVETYAVQPQGIGRVDYSQSVEVTTEPFITSWQNGYNFFQVVPSIPAGGSLIVDEAITSNLVVMLYDFFASVPSNRLIRMTVEIQDMTGLAFAALDKTDYQAIVVHISKGIPTINNIRFTLYNYAAVAETHMVIGCCGMYTTLAEYTFDISDLPLP